MLVYWLYCSVSRMMSDVSLERSVLLSRWTMSLNVSWWSSGFSSVKTFLRETSQCQPNQTSQTPSPNSLTPTGWALFIKHMKPHYWTATESRGCRNGSFGSLLQTTQTQFPRFSSEGFLKVFFCFLDDDGWHSHWSQNNTLTWSLLENTLFINHMTNRDMIFMIVLTLLLHILVSESRCFGKEHMKRI